MNREAELREAIALDRQFLAGCRLGFNLGVYEDRVRLALVIECRSAEIRTALAELATEPQK